MTPRLYNRITTGCLLVGTVSAFVFERLGRLNWIAGVLGILAGATAVITYFVNQSFSSKQTCSPEERLAVKVSAHSSMPDLTTERPFGVKALAMYVDGFASYDAISFHGDGIYRTAVSAGIMTYSDADLRESGVIPESSDPFVGYVVNIVDKLCATENDLEFEVTREGNLLIRQARRSSWQYIAPDSDVAAEPTLQFPEQVH